MSSLSLIDSILFGGSFVGADMHALFDSDAFVSRCVETEVALAKAPARLARELVGYPILPILAQLVDACGEAGHYLHWGDDPGYHDTATVLQIRSALVLPSGGLWEPWMRYAVLQLSLGIRRWPDAPIYNMRCRLHSITRQPFD